MNPLLKYTCSLILMLVLLDAGAQSKYAPKTVRVGYDLSTFVNMLVNDDLVQAEVTADVDFDRYFLVADFGYQRRGRTGNDFDYINRGTYFRIGPDVNFNYKNQYNSTLFIGFRYARSFFNDEMTYTVDNPLYGETNGFSQNDAVNAGWWEIVAGMKVRVWKELFLGYTARLKFAKSISKTDELAPFDIPGFGKVADETSFGFNYYIFWRFNWGEKKPESEKN